MTDRPTERPPFALALVIRDWLHETPLSQCNGGSDTCGTWPMAEDLAAKIMESGAVRRPTEGETR